MEEVQMTELPEETGKELEEEKIEEKIEDIEGKEEVVISEERKLERTNSRYYPAGKRPASMFDLWQWKDLPPLEEKDDKEVLPPKGSFFQLNTTTKLYYEIDGADNEKKIILLPPWICTVRFFDDLTDKLVAQGMSVLRFDARCVGKTESEYDVNPSTLWALDAVKLLDHVKWEKVHVFGFAT